MAYRAEIPYGAYWSTPFAKWQGSFAHLHSIEFGAHVAKAELAKRDIAPTAFDFGVLIQRAVLDEGIDENQDPRGGDVGHFFGNQRARSRGSAPVNHPRTFALAKFFHAIKFILPAAARFHACAGLFG